MLQTITAMFTQSGVADSQVQSQLYAVSVPQKSKVDTLIAHILCPIAAIQSTEREQSRLFEVLGPSLVLDRSRGRPCVGETASWSCLKEPPGCELCGHSYDSHLLYRGATEKSILRLLSRGAQDSLQRHVHDHGQRRLQCLARSLNLPDQ